MFFINPFKGLRPTKENASSVTIASTDHLSEDKKIELLTRNTFGSNNLYTNFTSLSGSVKKYGYYFFCNRKRGDGFRKNSDFYY